MRSSASKPAARLLVFLLSCLLLTGCWDEVTVQDLHYITALGIDYEEASKNFTIYAHIIDLTGVAKREQGGGNDRGISFVGKAAGHSPAIALNELYHTMQMQPNIDHLMTVVISESAIPYLEEMLDLMNRSRAVRYTVQMMATTDPIPNLFMVSEFVGKSPLNTNIYQPVSNKESLPIVDELDLQHMVRSFRTPTAPTFFPILSLEQNHWQSSKQAMRLTYFNGAFVVWRGHTLGKFSEAQLAGARWLRGAIEYYPIVVEDAQGDTIAVLRVERVKRKVSYSSSHGPGIRVGLSVQVRLAELNEEREERELERLAEAKIKEALETTRALGIGHKADLLGLETHLYRYRNAEWKRLKREKTAFEKLPVQLDVIVRITNTGKKKLVLD